jgi:hypothetical protein
MPSPSPIIQADTHMIKQSIVLITITPLLVMACGEAKPTPALSTPRPVPITSTPTSVPPVPTQTPAPPTQTATVLSSTPTSTPKRPDCTWEEVSPQLYEVQPAEAVPGDEITVIGSGGYFRDNCGGYNESSRTFQLYFDDELGGTLVCYVNHCEAKLTIPAGASPGLHCISVAEAGCDIDIQVNSN